MHFSTKTSESSIIPKSILSTSLRNLPFEFVRSNVIKLQMNVVLNQFKRLLHENFLCLTFIKLKCLCVQTDQHRLSYLFVLS